MYFSQKIPTSRLFCPCIYLTHYLGMCPNWYTYKAELLQLELTPIICVMNFINKKVGNQKTKPT